jgi:hypothetical protein
MKTSKTVILALIMTFVLLSLAACAADTPSPAPQPTEQPTPATEATEVPTKPSASQTEPSVPPQSEEVPEYYQLLADEKAALVEVVYNRVKAYKTGMPPDNPNHHPVYPDDFPPVSELPDIESENDFAIRFTGNLDALGGFYLAVPIDGEHELHMTASRAQDDNGDLAWMSGDTFFEKLSAIQWELQDIDLYADPIRPVSNYPDQAKEYLRASLDGSLLVRIDRDKNAETVEFPGKNYSDADLSPNGEYILCKTNAMSAGEASWCGYTVLDLTASQIMSHPYDGEQWGYQNHIILSDELIGFASGNVIGGQEDNWESVKLFDNRYNKLDVPGLETDIQVVGIGYDRTEERYVLAYAVDLAEGEAIPFSDNRLVIAVYRQDGALIREYQIPDEYMSLYSRNLLLLTPNNPVVARNGQILIRVMLDPQNHSPSLLVIQPDGLVEEIPSCGEGFRLSADGNHAFAIGLDNEGALVSSILDLNQPGLAAQELPATAFVVDGYAEPFTPIDAVLRDNHTYILAESYTEDYELFSGLFYWDGEQAELLQILPGRGDCSLAGVGVNGECYVMIHGVSGDIPEYADKTEYIKSLIG